MAVCSDGKTVENPKALASGLSACVEGQVQLDPAGELAVEAQRHFVGRWLGAVIALVADPVNQREGVVFPVAPFDVLQVGSNVGRQ